MNNNNENSKEAHSEALNIADVSGSCKCIDCGKEFNEYDFTEDCWNCSGDGEVVKEMEWEYEPSIYTCSTCKGKGHVTYKEKNRCKNCKWDIIYNNEENEEDEHCSSCCRFCNCG